jgi:hypothetical protein
MACRHSNTPAWCDECYLLFVLLRHLDLVVPREDVHKAKEITTSGSVKNLVNPRERVWIFWTSLVEAGEVYALL